MKRKSIASLALAGLVLAGSIMPAQAAENKAYANSEGAVNETQQVTENKSAQCEVYAEVGSSFTVTIPKSITLDGETKSGSYTVTCTGDIAGNEYISVIPESSFDMTQTGKNPVAATVTQATTKFRGNNYTGEVGTGETKMESGATGAISASGLTAGAWNGSFNFAVALERDAVASN